MPKKDGLEALMEIKKDDKLKDIPVIILTSSGTEEDINKSYILGATFYITKPGIYDKLIDIMSLINSLFFDIVELPRRNK
jgi:CheY-like chemotaxis protein